MKSPFAAILTCRTVLTGLFGEDYSGYSSRVSFCNSSVIYNLLVTLTVKRNPFVRGRDIYMLFSTPCLIALSKPFTPVTTAVPFVFLFSGYHQAFTTGCRIMLPKPFKLAQRPRATVASLVPYIILILFPLILFLKDGLIPEAPLVLTRFYAQEPYLNVVTLIYGQENDHVNIAHNCRIISATPHKFFIHTDDMSQPYCSICNCIHYNLFRCPCPTGADGCKTKNPCEKIEFLIQSVDRYQSFLFLDNDLLIMKPTFLDHMLQRSRAHDFLASYAHQTVNSSRYLRNFNSGLMFIRKVPNVDYNLLRASLYYHKPEQDQGVVSDFFQKMYSNWDSLSWKWHCRSLKRAQQDIPPESCYTIHDRSEVADLLKALNKTRLTIP